MRFGLLCSARATRDGEPGSPGQGLRDWLEFNEEAERLGFYSTFLVEHHFTGWDQVSATLTLLGCLAMRTTTLRLGSGVLALPWHNPVLLAEQAATVDLVSGGRLDLGIGRGYRHSEFAGFGIAPEEGQRRFEEAVEVMTRGWTTADRFSHAGTYWRFDDIVVEPKPAQSRHPPLWMAAGSNSSVARAAAAGYNLMLDQYASPVQLAERIATYRDQLATRLPASRTFCSSSKPTPPSCTDFVTTSYPACPNRPSLEQPAGFGAGHEMPVRRGTDPSSRTPRPCPADPTLPSPLLDRS